MLERTTEFRYDVIADPRVYAENRLPARAAFEAFPNAEALRAGETRGENPLRVSLNGVWRFHHALNLNQLLDGCMSADYDCTHWESIRVPGHIQMQGYGTPQYVNTMYPWDGREHVERGEVPQDYNPVATYVRYFDLPEGWASDRVIVRFNGVESAYALWVNGSYIGYATDSFTPSEFDLTAALQERENKLTVQVFRFSSSTWAEDQDFFRFSGIYRDVDLIRIPATSLWDYTIRTDVADHYQSATVRVAVELETEEEATVELKLTNALHELVAQASATTAGAAELKLPLEDPELWSAEHPYLYELEIAVKDASGEVVSYHFEPVGIRRFEIADGLMKLNGERIVFNGVNRHDFSAEHGRSVLLTDIYEDMILMKQHNINAIRTSHYPSRHELYRWADELGFYVIAENNLESHGAWPSRRLGEAIDVALPGDREDWLDIMLDRVDSTYQRDKNRPSVLIWSVGNEAYGGTVIRDMAQRFRDHDDSRLVHYEGIFNDRRYNESSDMESQMYTSVEGIKSFLQAHPEKPFIVCEYTHAMGNSIGGMHKYTDYTDEEPLFQGGFIWDYIDQTIWTKDRYGQDYLGYGGDFGDRPHDDNFSGDGILFGDHGITPKMQEVKANYQPLVITADEEGFTVRNRALFTHSNEWICSLTLESEGRTLDYMEIETDVAPGETKSYEWPWDKRTTAGEYLVTVSFTLWNDLEWAAAGHEIAFGQAVYTVTSDETQHPAKNTRFDGTYRELTSSRDLVVTQGSMTVGVKGLDFEALFEKRHGGLVSYNYGGQELLEGIVKPNYWRAPTDNDRGYKMERQAGFWKLASLYQLSDEPQVETLADGRVQVRYVFSLAADKDATSTVTYTISRDGTIRVDQELAAQDVDALLPEFSLLFKLSADVDRFTWYGLGPEETYADRKRGGKLGLWETTVEANFAKYPRPQESGAHQHVRWARVTDRKGRGILFTADPDGRSYDPTQGPELTSEITGGMTFSAVHWTPHEIENARHHFELPDPHYTIVRCAQAQMGVGGDNSWGAQVHEEYHLDTSEPLKHSFSFRGVV